MLARSRGRGRAATATGLMRFNSVEYFVFLIVVVGVFWAARPSARPILITVASLLFYGFREWRFVPLLVGTILVSYVTARLLPSSPPGRRRLLAGLSIAAMVAVLAGFKVLGSTQGGGGFALDGTFSLIVPVGLSFYVFQAIAYTVDVYRGDVEPERDLIAYSSYVSFFPHLLAGPIIRFRRFRPQLDALPRSPRRIDVVEGLELLFLGLFKKVAVADVLIRVAFEQGRDVVADQARITSTTFVLLVVMVIIGGYFDIAGYIDMARGSAKLLGIEMPRNFAQPLTRSRDLTDFWRRWQTTIMAWLRDYLYRPLRGSTRSRGRTFAAILATFMVAGLWHGLDLGWLVWGVLTASILMAERANAQRRIAAGRPAKPRRTGAALLIGPLYVFGCLLLTLPWVAGEGASGAVTIYRAMLAGGWTTDWNVAVFAAYGVLVLVLADRQERRRHRPLASLSSWALVGRSVSVGLMVVALVVFSGGAGQDFLYFRF